MDDVLCRIIKAKLLPSIEKNDELFDGAYSPFSTFSSRIDLAYRVALIRPAYRSSLHLLRKIRNDFAHQNIAKGFENPSTQDRIRNILHLNWELIIPLLDSIEEATEHENLNLNDMPKLIGWRTTVEFLFASIAAALLDQLDNVQSIEPLD